MLCKQSYYEFESLFYVKSTQPDLSDCVLVLTLITTYYRFKCVVAFCFVASWVKDTRSCWTSSTKKANVIG